MTVVSLFSGAGGLDLGLIQAGNRVVWANDIDKDAVATYRRNIGGHIVLGDIAGIDIASIPDADVVVGGFPCQGFSQANLRKAASDERNQLYKFFRDVVRAKQPKFFIAENVKGILSMERGAAIDRIAGDFQAAGYNLSVNLVNMADYGVPQTRQRVIILGQHTSLGGRVLLSIPKPTHREGGRNMPHWVSMRKAIGHFPEPGGDCGIPNHVCSAYKVAPRDFTGHRPTDPDKPSPTILARGNGGGGVCAIPHYNGRRRLTVRESACIQTFPEDFVFEGAMNSCYRQVGNAVPVRFARLLGEELIKIEKELRS